MQTHLLALEIGPLKPNLSEMIVMVVLFAAVFLFFYKVLLPRINSTLEEREAQTSGKSEEAEALREEAAQVHAEYQSVLAEARHEAARIRQQAQEEGTAAITAARAEGNTERERILAAGAERLETERASAERELSNDVEAWARSLASSVVGEPVGPARSERG